MVRGSPILKLSVRNKIVKYCQPYVKCVGRHRHNFYEFEVRRVYLVVIDYVVFTCFGKYILFLYA